MNSATAGLRFAVPLRPTVGTRGIDPSQWLVRDDRRELLAHKRRLIAGQRRDVVQVGGLARSVGLEAAELLLGNYAEYHPGVLLRSGSLVTDAESGHVVDLAAEHPIVAASQLVAEDLCVMVERAGVWTLAGACVCFPSRWSLASKVGRSLDDIHDVVPGYAGGVADASRRVFDRIGEQILLRFNWTLLDDANLFQPQAPTRPWQPSVEPEQLYLRVERQTLRRLPSSGAVLFAIHTSVEPLAQVGERPEQARNLAASLRSSTPATREYKGWGALVDRAAGFLEERAADGASRQ